MAGTNGAKGSSLSPQEDKELTMAKAIAQLKKYLNFCIKKKLNKKLLTYH
jgi:hypothetical protein